MAREGSERRGTDPVVMELDRRVGKLEGRMGNVESRLGTYNLELAANTALTKQTHEKTERIERDTATIVEATRWLSTTKKLVIVIVSAVAGSAGAIVAAVHALRALSEMIR